MLPLKKLAPGALAFAFLSFTFPALADEAARSGFPPPPWASAPPPAEIVTDQERGTVTIVDEPVDCPNIGDACDDGTVFAGNHPITNNRLFIPPTDQDIAGDFTLAWKTSTGTDDISPDSTNDGEANDRNRGGATADFPAFQACEDLSFGGHNDWYLPSQVEAYYLWSIHETIEAGGNVTNFNNAYYWSSTEVSTSGAWFQNFTSGFQVANGKTDGYRVRCVRR